VAAYAALLITRDTLMQGMLDGKMDERKWRALSEAHRQVESLGSRLGLIPAQPRAGGSAAADPDEYLDDEEYIRRITAPHSKERP